MSSTIFDKAWLGRFRSNSGLTFVLPSSPELFGKPVEEEGKALLGDSGLAEAWMSEVGHPNFIVFE
jgi:hypothetical protein